MQMALCNVVDIKRAATITQVRVDSPVSDGYGICRKGFL